MAEQAVTKAIELKKLKPQNKCKTKTVMLIGGHKFSNPKQPEEKNKLLWNLSHDFSVPVDVMQHLLSSYGDRATEIALLAKQHNLGGRLAEVLCDDGWGGDCGDEVAMAVMMDRNGNDEKDRDDDAAIYIFAKNYQRNAALISLSFAGLSFRGSRSFVRCKERIRLHYSRYFGTQNEARVFEQGRCRCCRASSDQAVDWGLQLERSKVYIVISTTITCVCDDADGDGDDDEWLRWFTKRW